jgi:hypothetical protein
VVILQKSGTHYHKLKKMLFKKDGKILYQTKMIKIIVVVVDLAVIELI